MTPIIRAIFDPPPDFVFKIGVTGGGGMTGVRNAVLLVWDSDGLALCAAGGLGSGGRAGLAAAPAGGCCCTAPACLGPHALSLHEKQTGLFYRSVFM